jgi:nucleoside-diphosphate-sugar epimerase
MNGRNLMNILVTGGFGNIGMVVVNECLRRGHKVSIFEIPNRRTEKLARKYIKRNVKVWLGDLRKADDIANAIIDQDVVIHLAAILPPISEERPDLCKAVNVVGTDNLIGALRKSSKRPALVEVSSASVMGPTQNRTPPVQPNDPVSPTDVYSSSKIEAEALVKVSGLQYCILRLAAVLPTHINLFSMLKMIKMIFDMPLNARCEIVFEIDVAYALVSAAENLSGSGKLSGKTGFIAGGRQQSCQIVIKDMLMGVFNPMGLDIPDESLFPPDLNSYYLDWYETKEMQSILGYQRHTFEQWQEIITKNYRFLRPLIYLFRKRIMKWIEKQSPRQIKA